MTPWMQDFTSTRVEFNMNLLHRKRVTTISSGSDIPITQPLRIEERSVHYGKQCNDIQMQPNMERRGTLHDSNKSLNEIQATMKFSPSSKKLVRDLHFAFIPVTEHKHYPILQDFVDQSTSNRPKMNSHMNSSTHSVTHSNTELNNICPHAKGSTKSEYCVPCHPSHLIPLVLVQGLISNGLTPKDGRQGLSIKYK